MLKAALKDFQRPSSLFYLISLKQLQICKYTSKIGCSRQKMYTATYVKLAKRTECFSRWCKMLYRHIKLYLVIEISKQSSEKYVQPAKTICNSIFSLFISDILVVLFSSLSKEIYVQGSCDVNFYIAFFQKNMICKTSFLNQECPFRTLKILKLLNK